MNHLEKFRAIKAFIFEVDGVIANKELLLTENGALLRRINRADLMALRKAVDADYKIGIIAEEPLAGLEKVFLQLGINKFFYDQPDKVGIYEAFLKTYELEEDNLLYMGSDLEDYPVMRKVALPCCPRDAAPEIIGMAQYVSSFESGQGCVRDVLEKVLRLNGQWVQFNDDNDD